MTFGPFTLFTSRCQGTFKRLALPGIQRKDADDDAARARRMVHATATGADNGAYEGVGGIPVLGFWSRLQDQLSGPGDVL